MRKEVWYKPDLSLYCDMILLLGKNKLIEFAEELFYELKKEGLEPDTRAFTEMIGAYMHVGMTEKVMETYELMKASGCTPDKLTFKILIKNLEKEGEEELVAAIKKECAEHIESPEKFLEEVAKKHVRNPFFIFSYPLFIFIMLYSISSQGEILVFILNEYGKMNLPSPFIIWRRIYLKSTKHDNKRH